MVRAGSAVQAWPVLPCVVRAGIREEAAVPRILHVSSGENVRELGGYPLPSGEMTPTHRFIRSGYTSGLTARDLRYLRRYGVRRVLDLRSAHEVRTAPDPFAKLGRDYLNVSLYGRDLHDPALALPVSDDATITEFLTSGYLDMLANRGAVRECIAFLAAAPSRTCTLFHCTAGMDRTGVISMLLLAAAGADRAHIIADYAYSYADPAEVDGWVFGGLASASGTDPSLYEAALTVMAAVYDRLCSVYGDVPSYLRVCGVTGDELAALWA